jgi:cytochrome c biogenesis protein
LDYLHKRIKNRSIYSGLSLLDEDGKEIKRKIVFVNEPLVYKDIVLYQTDWDIVGIKLKLENEQNFQIPLKRITKGGNRFWFGSLNFGFPTNTTDTNLTVVINYLKGKIVLYNSKGEFLQELQLGESFVTQGNTKVQFADYITSTGLQIKSDPGINIVYLSFLLLMISIYVSFFTYSQIWFVEAKNGVILGGKSNCAVLFFQQEFRQILKRSINIRS